MENGEIYDDARWVEMQDSMKIGRAALDRMFDESPEEKAGILKERAAALAKTEKRIEDGAFLEVVEFMLAHEKYAIELTHIREVYPLIEITSLPRTPSFVMGIINVRGQILSVIDVKKFFDLPAKGLTNLNQVIILKNDEMEFGILADMILGVRLIPVEIVQPQPAAFRDVRVEYLKGVTNEPLVILDGARILGDKKIIVHEDV